MRNIQSDRSRARLVVCTLGIFLLASNLRADAGNLAEDGGYGVFRLQSAELPEHTMLGISLYNRLLNMNTSVDALNSLLQGPTVTPPGSQPSAAQLWALNNVLAASISTHRFFEFHVAVPLYYQDLVYQNNGQSEETQNYTVGDVRYLLKLAMPVGNATSPLSAALLAGGSAPTSQTGSIPVPTRLEYAPENTSVLKSGGSRASGDHRDDWEIGGALTLDFEHSAMPLPVAIHVNALGRKTSAFTPEDSDFYDVMAVGAGFEGKVSEYVSLLGEYWHENLLDNTPTYDPQLNELTVGLGFHTPVGLSVLLGSGFALFNHSLIPTGYFNSDGADEYNFNARPSPNAQIILAITYTGVLSNLDRDHDGIPDDKDKCPDVPGVAQFAGCPNPDQDGDKICDPWVGKAGLSDYFSNICKDIDKCPTVPGLAKYQGCPMPDKDGDGVPDDQDKCPDVPGLAKFGGCPNPDKDSDGVCDPWVTQNGLSTYFANICTGIDKCPDDPEDKDGFEDEDGCPDPDNDKDGICDPWVAEKGLSAKYASVCKGSDKCPNQPETFNGYQDEDGCPDVAPVQQKTLILHGVNFETGKSTLLPESFPILDDIAAQLKAAPDIKVEVSGHTDNVGGYQYNMNLSRSRAQSVADYLIQKGVASDRLKVAGYGFTKPIASNHTAEGRLQNRRVEFNRIQ